MTEPVSVARTDSGNQGVVGEERQGMRGSTSWNLPCREEGLLEVFHQDGDTVEAAFYQEQPGGSEREVLWGSSQQAAA